MKTPLTIGLLALVLLSACAIGSEEPDDIVRVATDSGDYEAARKSLERALDENPNDLDSRFALARVLAWSGDLAAATSQYEQLIARDPDNVDYSFGRAQVLAWAHRDEEALSELARARSLAPDYEDIWQLEFEILQRSPDPGDRLEKLHERAQRRFPNSQWWSRPPSTSAQPLLGIEVGARRESVSSGMADWRSSYFRISKRGSRIGELYGGIRQETRFNLSDTLLEAGGSWPVREKWTVGLGVSLAHDRNFSPGVDASVWATRPLPRGWETEVRVRRSRYPDESVVSVGLTAARYVGDFRFGYTVVPTRLEGSAGATSHVATIDYYRSERMRVRLILAGGAEIETIGPAQIARTEVRAVSLLVVHALSDRWDIAWQLGTHRQGNLYRRQFFAVSLSTRI